MTSERLVLWLAALAVFLVVNPVTGLDGRTWQEIVFVYGGFAAVAWALSGGGLLGLFSIWLLVVAVIYRGPSGFNAVLMLLAFLGLVALARATGHASLILRAIVGVNVAVFALQAAGLWVPLLSLAFPAASLTVYNSLHPHTGLTSSTGDLACVLAVALPLTFTARWWPIGAAGVVVLLWTSALSAIVAGLIGLLIAAWPRIRALGKEWLIGYGVVGLFAVSVACQSAEIRNAFADARWIAWGRALRLWLLDSSAAQMLAGRGLGSWQAAGVYRDGPNGPELWGALHFDLLQLGYEAGAVAVILALLVVIVLVAGAVQGSRWALVGALVALCICQFGHFPFHLAAPSVVAALVVGEGLSE